MWTAEDRNNAPAEKHRKRALQGCVINDEISRLESNFKFRALVLMEGGGRSTMNHGNSGGTVYAPFRRLRVSDGSLESRQVHSP